MKHEKSQKIIITGNHKGWKKYTPGSMLGSSEVLHYVGADGRESATRASKAAIEIEKGLSNNYEPTKDPLFGTQITYEADGSFTLSGNRLVGKDKLHVKVPKGFNPEKPYSFEFGKGVEKSFQQKIEKEVPKVKEHKIEVSAQKRELANKRRTKHQEKQLESKIFASKQQAMKTKKHIEATRRQAMVPPEKYLQTSQSQLISRHKATKKPTHTSKGIEI